MASSLIWPGWVKTRCSFVTIPMLGVYPSLQVLLMQLIVLAAVVGGFAWNHLTARQTASTA